MQDVRGEAAQPGTDLFSAVGRHLALFLLPILVLGGAGVAYGLVRKPHYTRSRVSRSGS